MNLQESADKFALWINEIIYSSLEEDDDNYIFKTQPRDDTARTFTLAKEELENEIKLMNEAKQDPILALFTENRYEILIREENRYHFPYLSWILKNNNGDGEEEDEEEDGEENDKKENIFSGITDHENKITYTLKNPSTQFLLILIEKASVDGHKKYLRLGSNNRAARILSGLKENANIFEYVLKVIGTYFSLEITSTKEKKISEFEKFASAILFNIAYNANIPLVQYKNINDVFIPQKIADKKRSSIMHIDPPRRTYISDIVNYYQLAVGSENPVLQYISYYHIIEHFFEEVFSDSLIDKVKDKITNPSFSYKSKRDISSLIKEITRSVKIQKDSTTFNEKEALKLTLKKYIDVQELTRNLDKYNPSLIDYYENNDVSFSGAKKIKIREEKSDSLCSSISNRIYENRNSIVHSKESEKNKYTPFHDNQTLSKEIPLIKLISEQIIIGSSSSA